MGVDSAELCAFSMGLFQHEAKANLGAQRGPLPGEREPLISELAQRFTRRLARRSWRMGFQLVVSTPNRPNHRDESMGTAEFQPQKWV